MADFEPDPPALGPNERAEWAGISYLLGEVGALEARGLIAAEAAATIRSEYAARRSALGRRGPFDRAIGRARALADSSPWQALEWAEQARAIDPGRPEGWLATVLMLRRLGREGQAGPIAAEAIARFPELAARLAAPPRPPTPAVAPRREPRAPGPVTPPWSAAAGAFLEEHWQKLLLGLAVLLILVSSTVGAYHVLGPKLWSPAGKVILALGFTAVCSAFGAGLVRWGAERAGRMMLGTTLIVAPVNLMLAGELRLLADPSPWGVGLLAVDLAALFGLCRGVVGALGFAPRGRFAASYFALAAANAAAWPGMPFEWAFAAILAAAAIFLLAVGRLDRTGGADAEFGLLGFAFAAGLFRTGALILHQAPALYAIPAMAGAIAAVAMAGPGGGDRRRAAILRQGGLTLSALAFALALARPPVASALLSGNTLATACLGLALYAGLLRSTRRPAYLYCGFAALFLAYFGVMPFLKDLIQSAESVASRALGYDRKLPLPFKAINGWAFNLGLAWLAASFARRRPDSRLAWHCHAIALPLSVGACILSGFEPLAGEICLSGYAFLYSLAAARYRRPALLYLAAAALAGAGTLASPSDGVRGVLEAALGLIFVGIGSIPLLGPSYRAPLIRSARVLGAAALVVASRGVLGAAIGLGPASGWAVVASALAAVLALLDGRARPRLAAFIPAIGAMLAAWLGGFQLLGYGAEGYGPAVAAFALAALAASELVRPRSEGAEARVGFLLAVGWSVPALVVVAWALAAGRMEFSGSLAGTLAAGGVGCLWLTRFRRDPALVYLGLLGLAAAWACGAGVAEIGRGITPGSGVGLGRLALAVATSGLLAWAAGALGRARGWPEFYREPCLDVAGAMALASAPVALLARGLDVAAYRPALAALLAGSMTFALLARARRRPLAVGLATAWAVGASDLLVLSQGRADPDSLWVLGLVAAAEGVTCWALGRGLRRWAGGVGSPLVRPLDGWAAALTLASLPLGERSAAVLLVAAASFLLLVESTPRLIWIYAALGALAAAACRAGLSGLPRGWPAFASVAGAYGCLALAEAARRSGPRARARLGLADLAYHLPPFHAALVLGAVAAAVRVAEVAGGSSTWSDRSWLPWLLAPLALGMLRFDPRRPWADLAVGLTAFGLAANLATLLPGRAWWWPAGPVLAHLWAIAARAERGGPTLTRWALGAAAASAAGLATLATASALGGDLAGPGAWPEVAAAIGLLGLLVATEGRRLDGDGLAIGSEVVALPAAWWLVAPGSPIPPGPDRPGLVAALTAAVAVGAVGIGLARGRRAVADEEFAASRSERLDAWTRWFGLGVAAMALALAALAGPAFGRLATAAVLGAAGALGALALGRGRVESAYLGGLAGCWGLTLADGLIRGAPNLPWAGDPLAAILGAFALCAAGGWARRPAKAKAGSGPSPGVALALERVAALAAAWAAVGGALDGTGAGGPVALVLAAVVYGWLAHRWRMGGPVYAAQALLLGAYLRARGGLGTSAVTDAAILSALAYLDLGLAELMARLRWDLYARPTLRFAPALPLVPLAEAVAGGRGDRVDLLVVLAASAFYALAGARLRSRTPGYAAAVLFNAFLWLGWSRLGWRVADQTPFYLIPVGLTTILFAEVNRRDLGRSVVNGARNLGLVLIYASLAAPIWRTESFAAWLALLVFSLAGVLVGIAARIQSFLWLGLACFVADLTYQVGRIGLENATARWAVMLALGVLLVLFVALNEKKQIVATARGYYDRARTWE